MLLIYTPVGRVQQTCLEPVPDDYADRLAALGLRCATVADDWLGDRSIADVYVVPITCDVLPRPPHPAQLDKTTIRADGRDAATLSGLPDPTTVFVDGEPHVVADGTLVLTSAMPATYVLAIDAWPYLPWSAEVTVR